MWNVTRNAGSVEKAPVSPRSTVLITCNIKVQSRKQGIKVSLILLAVLIHTNTIHLYNRLILNRYKKLPYKTPLLISSHATIKPPPSPHLLHSNFNGQRLHRPDRLNRRLNRPNRRLYWPNRRPHKTRPHQITLRPFLLIVPLLPT